MHNTLVQLLEAIQRGDRIYVEGHARQLADSACITDAPLPTVYTSQGVHPAGYHVPKHPGP